MGISTVINQISDGKIQNLWKPTISIMSQMADGNPEASDTAFASNKVSRAFFSENIFAIKLNEFVSTDGKGKIGAIIAN